MSKENLESEEFSNEKEPENYLGKKKMRILGRRVYGVKNSKKIKNKIKEEKVNKETYSEKFANDSKLAKEKFLYYPFISFPDLGSYVGEIVEVNYLIILDQDCF
jgi:hypothetical protein